MPHLTGVFEEFPDLDKVSWQNLAVWLPRQEKHLLVNTLGNRILYPQTIAASKSDLEIDFAILREAIKQKPASVYEPQTNKLYINEGFLGRFPPLPKLAGAIIEAINPKGVIQIYLKSKAKVKLLGTLISPVDLKLKDGESKIKVVVNGVAANLQMNTLSISKIESPSIKIQINDAQYTVSGGELGVIINLMEGKPNG